MSAGGPGDGPTAAPDCAVRIVVTGPLQPWARAGGRGSQRFTPAHVRKYQDVLRLAAQQAFGDRRLIEGAVHLRVRAYVSVPQSMPAWQRAQALDGSRRPISRPDLDNYAYLVSNVLNRVVWVDDSQVVSTDGSGKWYSDRPRLEVEVRELPAPPAFVRPSRSKPAGGDRHHVQPSLI